MPSPTFIFATGIENSNPTIHNGRTRVDEMEKCGHYARWREDFACTQSLGLRFLRYGPPLYRTHLGPSSLPMVRMRLRRESDNQSAFAK